MPEQKKTPLLKGGTKGEYCEGKNNNLVDEFRNARQEFIDFVDKLPDSGKSVIILGSWTLRDMLAHISAWGLHQIDILQQFKNGLEASCPLDVDAFNENAVLVRKSWGWNETYEEFLEVGDRLITEYESLSSDLWGKKIWSKRDTTPKEFIKIEIKHYQKEHLPQIRRFFDENLSI